MLGLKIRGEEECRWWRMWMGSQEWRGGQDEGARGAVWAQPLLTLHHFALSGREPDVPWKPKIRGKKEPATVSLHPLHNSKHQGRSSSNLFCFLFLFVRWHGRCLLPARWWAPTIYRVSPKKFPLKFIYSWSKILAYSPCLMRKIMILMDPANDDDQSAPGQIIIVLIPHKEYARILDQL